MTTKAESQWGEYQHNRTLVLESRKAVRTKDEELAEAKNHVLALESERADAQRALDKNIVRLKRSAQMLPGLIWSDAVGVCGKVEGATPEQVEAAFNEAMRPLVSSDEPASAEQPTNGV